MNDDKQKIVDDFASYLKPKVDELFQRDLSQEELDSVVMREIAEALNEATIINDITSTVTADTKEILSELKNTEAKLQDLDKLAKVREDLDIAA